MPWQADFFPEWMWHLMTNIGLLAAVVAAFTLGTWTVRWLWSHGPGLLIDHGPEWFTRIGHGWQARRD